MYHLHIWPRCFSNYCLCARSQKEYNLGVLQFLRSPRHKPHWFPKPDVMGLLFLVQVPQARAQILCTLEMTSTVVISLPLESHCMGSGMWDKSCLDVVPISPVSMWLFLYIYGCRKSVLLVFRSFSEIIFLYVIVVLVSVRSCELRIFLLCHLELKARRLVLECHFSLSVKSHCLQLEHCPCKKCVFEWDRWVTHNSFNVSNIFPCIDHFHMYSVSFVFV